LTKLFVSLLTLSLLLVSCTAPRPSATPSLPPGSDPLKTPWEDRSIFKQGLVASEQSVLGELPGASVYHIEFNILDNLDEVKGTEEIRYTNTEDVALPEVQLRLFPNTLGGEMTIHNLTVEGQVVQPKYALEDSLLIVPMPSPLEPGKSVILKLDFFVTVPKSVDTNYGVLAYAEEVLALAHAYPMVAVYDDEGWNAEIPPQSGDVTYADMSFFIVRINAPSEVKIISSGREISRTESGESQTLISASGPARDFYLVASPAYAETTGKIGEITIRSYAPEEFHKGSQMAVDVAARAIEDFSTRYAPYPYTELDIVATPTRALGIEYPGMIAIASRIYDVDQLLRGTPLSVYMESTVAHEVGHQWFYNLFGDDQLDDPWLDESLTQFATLQYYADEYGPSGAQGFQRSLESRWASVDKAKIPIGRSVAEYSGQEYSAIVYGRGPLFFVALREEMGTEAFDAFLKEYTQKLSWEIATPELLQSLAEKQCQCELDAIFNEWVY
jgi:aminopeptidase N